MTCFPVFATLSAGGEAAAFDLWLGIGPVALLAGLTMTAIAAYAVRCAKLGPACDAEQATRGGSGPLLVPAVRHFFAWAMSPPLLVIERLGITPMMITVASVVLAGVAGALAGAGLLAVAGAVYLLSGLCDFLDGRLARLLGKATRGGAALDSILDRYSDAAILVGLAYYFRESWVLWAVLGALTGSFLVPYIRARGEGLGVETKVGLMQRPERMVLLSLALLLEPPLATVCDTWGINLVAGALLLLAVLSHATAVTRIIHVLRALDADPPRRRP